MPLSTCSTRLGLPASHSSGGPAGRRGDWGLAALTWGAPAAMVVGRRTGYDQERGQDMCQHYPQCPAATAGDHTAARVVAAHPEQGWYLLCNGVVIFDDTGEL